MSEAELARARSHERTFARTHACAGPKRTHTHDAPSRGHCRRLDRLRPLSATTTCTPSATPWSTATPGTSCSQSDTSSGQDCGWAASDQVLKTVLLAVAVGRDRPSRRNLAVRWPVPLPCPCPCPRQLARRAAVPSCLPKAPDAASSCCYLRALISTTGGPQRTGVYVQFKIQALPHYPLPPEKPSTASEEEVLCSAIGRLPCDRAGFCSLGCCCRW